MSHVRDAPMHPQTQSKIEHWHQTLKNRILLENYFPPGDLEAQIEAFVAHYNNKRYHENRLEHNYITTIRLRLCRRRAALFFAATA